MATISYDGRSFLVAGRRIWLVSGTISYARTPHQLWRDRIRAAKQAGLNCIDTDVVWALHEPKPGKFDFQGDLDLRRFIQAVGREGMYCTLRPGPYTGDDRDFGGMPAWLHRLEGMRPRQSGGPFLEACARYLRAVLDQVRDLQITSANVFAPVLGVSGVDGYDSPFHARQAPIVMMQAEHQWFCDNPPQADAYLKEITRYLREYGCTVPIRDSNNLWPRVEGTISCWNLSRHPAGDMRQLSMIQPDAPRLVSLGPTNPPAKWNQEHHQDPDPQAYQTRLGAALAVGAQFNLHPFHGGTNFGFTAGQAVLATPGYACTSYDVDAPLREGGGHGLTYNLTKRLCTFASQFGYLFAHLEPAEQQVCLSPDDREHPLSVVQQRGPQGHVVFLFRGSGDGDKTPREARLLLPDGLTMPVPIGDDRLAWVVLHADLGGVATLRYTNLRPWAFTHRRLLVLFGPAGADGLIHLNETLLRIRVPVDQSPVVQRHQDLTVVVLSDQQVDTAYLSPKGVMVGAGGLDDRDRPIALKGWSHATTVQPDGRISRQKTSPHKTTPRQRPTPPRLGAWQQSALGEMVTGTSERFEPIDGPRSHEDLGCDTGYGWYRLTLKGTTKNTAKDTAKDTAKNTAKGSATAAVMAPQSADRLHLYQQGRGVKVLGWGPSAEQGPTRLKLHGSVVVLSDNLGHTADGWKTGEPKGLFGHLYAVKPVTLAKPTRATDRAPDLFALGGFFSHARWSDRPTADAMVWKVRPASRLPLILDIDRLPWRCVLMVNDQPVGAYDPVESGGYQRFVLHAGEQLTGGVNRLKLAMFQKLDPSEGSWSRWSKHLRLYQATANLTQKASWAFAPWTPPTDGAFKPFTPSRGNQPRWYRSRFKLSAIPPAPLWLEPAGMSKGQVYINGHNAGRYFVATHTGRAVPPQKRYYLPPSWLRTDQPNELWLFDEHGKDPRKCRLVLTEAGACDP